MIIVVTGADGSGKSTLCERLARSIPGAREVTIWDAVPSRERFLAEFAELDHPARLDKLLDAYRRALLMAGGRVLICNGFWYKYVASERAYGSTVLSPDGFPRPDRVICLDLPIEDITSRRADFSRYEQGLLGPAPQAGDTPIERFTAFQRRIAVEWKQVEAATGPWTHLSSRASPDVLFARALALIDPKRRPRTLIVRNGKSRAGHGYKQLARVIAEERALRDAAHFDTTQYRSLGEARLRLTDAITAIGAGARVVAAGGDGTVNLVANAVLDAQATPGAVKMGAIALGSSNDFHKPKKYAGIPRRVDFNRGRLVDVGTVAVDDGAARAFLVNASVGITAEAALAFNHAGPLLRLLKRLVTEFAIMATGAWKLLTHSNLEAMMYVGGERRAVNLTNLGVIKNRHFAGDFKYGTSEPTDSGLLGLRYAHDMDLGELLPAMVGLMQGRFEGTPKTVSQSVRALTLESQRPFAIEADGEVGHGHKATFGLRPRTLWVAE